MVAVLPVPPTPLASPTLNERLSAMTCPSLAKASRNVTKYVPSGRSGGRRTAKIDGLAGSASASATTAPPAPRTVMRLKAGSSDSLNQY